MWNRLSLWFGRILALFRGAAIFVSHKTEDKAQAVALKEHLTREMRFRTVFLDSDREQGIQPGEQWERRIGGQLRRSRAVVLLLTDSARQSNWCFAEVFLAKSLGKIIIPIRVGAAAGIASMALDNLVREYQGRTSKDLDEAIVDLEAGIRINNIDPREDVRQVVLSLPFLIPAVLVAGFVSYLTWDRVAESHASRIVKEVSSLSAPEKIRPVIVRLTSDRRRFASLANQSIEGTANRLGDSENNLAIMRLVDPNLGDQSKIQVNRDEEARGAANLVLGLLASDDPRIVDEAVNLALARFDFKADDRLRTHIVGRYRASGLPIDRLRRLLEEAVARPLPPRELEHVLMAVLGILGNYQAEELSTLKLPASARLIDPKASGQDESWPEWLSGLRKAHPSGAVHSSADWLIRRGALERKSLGRVVESPRKSPAASALWFYSPGGQLMIRVDPSTDMTDDLREVHPDWVSHPPFFIAACEVRRSEYAKAADHPDWEQPQGALTWAAAAEYCDWLNDRDEPPRSHAYRTIDGVLAPIATPLAKQAGYRLPTEVEWEIAARAGTITMRFHGWDPALLDRYAWLSRNTSGSDWAGFKQPNPFGLFDVYGGVAEWCHNRVNDPDFTKEGDGATFDPRVVRVSRGGARGQANTTPHSRTAESIALADLDLDAEFRGLRPIFMPAPK